MPNAEGDSDRHSHIPKKDMDETLVCPAIAAAPELSPVAQRGYENKFKGRNVTYTSIIA